MTDKVKNFMEQISTDEALKVELQATMERTGKEELVSNIIQFAKKHGREITEEDLVSEPEELSEQELEMVSAGKDCYCGVAGNGSGEGLGCGCNFYGTGGVKGNLPDSQGGCQCIMVGVGLTNRH